ncbi:MAG: anti-sigma factor family protein [Fimbriimonadales bacterium]
MIECRNLEQRLTLYVLGELDRRAEIEVEAHLAGCRFCCDEETSLRRDVDRLRDIVSTDLRAPAGLMQQVESLVREKHSHRPTGFRPLALVAGLAIALVLLVTFFFRTGIPPSTMAVLVDDYSRNRAIMTGPPSMAQLAMLSKEVGFVVKAMTISPSAKLVDCGPVTADGIKTAKLVYDDRGRRMIFYQLPMKEARVPEARQATVHGRAVYVVADRGMVAIGWQCDQSFYVLVAEGEKESLMKTAEPLIKVA